MTVVLMDAYRVARDEREEVYRECLLSQLMFGRVEDDGPSYQPRVSEEELDQALASTSLTPREIAKGKRIATAEADFVYQCEVERLAYGRKAVRP